MHLLFGLGVRSFFRFPLCAAARWGREGGGNRAPSPFPPPALPCPAAGGQKPRKAYNNQTNRATNNKTQRRARPARTRAPRSLFSYSPTPHAVRPYVNPIEPDVDFISFPSSRFLFLVGG